MLFFHFTIDWYIWTYYVSHIAIYLTDSHDLDESEHEEQVEQEAEEEVEQEKIEQEQAEAEEEAEEEAETNKSSHKHILNDNVPISNLFSYKASTTFPLVTDEITALRLLLASRNYYQEQQADNYVLVFLYVPWCPFSWNLLPRLVAIAEAFPQIKCLALDGYENWKFTARYMIRGFPNVLLFENGRLLTVIDDTKNLSNMLTEIYKWTSKLEWGLSEV